MHRTITCKMHTDRLSLLECKIYFSRFIKYVMTRLDPSTWNCFVLSLLDLLPLFAFRTKIPKLSLLSCSNYSTPSVLSIITPVPLLLFLLKFFLKDLSSLSLSSLLSTLSNFQFSHTSITRKSWTPTLLPFLLAWTSWLPLLNISTLLIQQLVCSQ